MYASSQPSLEALARSPSDPVNKASLQYKRRVLIVKKLNNNRERTPTQDNDIDSSIESPIQANSHFPTRAVSPNMLKNMIESSAFGQKSVLPKLILPAPEKPNRGILVRRDGKSLSNGSQPLLFSDDRGSQLSTEPNSTEDFNVRSKRAHNVSSMNNIYARVQTRKATTPVVSTERERCKRVSFACKLETVTVFQRDDSSDLSSRPSSTESIEEEESPICTISDNTKPVSQLERLRAAESPRYHLTAKAMFEGMPLEADLKKIQTAKVEQQNNFIVPNSNATILINEGYSWDESPVKTPSRPANSSSTVRLPQINSPGNSMTSSEVFTFSERSANIIRGRQITTHENIFTNLQNSFMSAHRRVIKSEVPDKSNFSALYQPTTESAVPMRLNLNTVNSTPERRVHVRDFCSVRRVQLTQQ